MVFIFSDKREFRCFEAKIEESEKAGRLRELNPGHKPGVLGLIPFSHSSIFASNISSFHDIKFMTSIKLYIITFHLTYYTSSQYRTMEFLSSLVSTMLWVGTRQHVSSRFCTNIMTCLNCIGTI